MPLKEFFKRYAKKACYCEDCRKTEMYEIHKKVICKFCGSHKIKPTKRPF